MDLGLKGKVALITGGSKGIGNASDWELAREGTHMALVARGRQRVEQVAAEIAKAAGVKTLPLVGDMATGEDAKRVVHQTAEHFGRIDILVNCAGSSPGGNIEVLREEEW